MPAVRGTSVSAAKYRSVMGIAVLGPTRAAAGGEPEGDEMIICHEHEFIFLKTRKTAGTSLEISFSEVCGDRDIITPISAEDELLRARGPQNFKIRRSGGAREWIGRLTSSNADFFYNHMTAENIRSLIDGSIWTKYYKFCFERNPWDKAVSLYFWRTRGQEPRPSLLSFLNTIDADSLSNFGIYSIGGDVAVDHVGRYEDLKSEVEDIRALLDLTPGVELPRTKASCRVDSRHYSEIMGEEEEEIVARVCSREISLFDYRF